MCLGVPGQVVHWITKEGIFSRAVIDFSGVQRECEMACVGDAAIGDYVIVHAGVAISRVDPGQAEQTLKDWSTMQIRSGISTEESD